MVITDWFPETEIEFQFPKLCGNMHLFSPKPLGLPNLDTIVVGRSIESPLLQLTSSKVAPLKFCFFVASVISAIPYGALFKCRKKKAWKLYYGMSDIEMIFERMRAHVRSHDHSIFE